MQASFVSTVRIGSPSLRAMSAIERSMIVVENGSSIGKAASPSAPPPAPVAATITRCHRLAAGRGA